MPTAKTAAKRKLVKPPPRRAASHVTTGRNVNEGTVLNLIPKGTPGRSAINAQAKKRGRPTNAEIAARMESEAAANSNTSNVRSLRSAPAARNIESTTVGVLSTKRPVELLVIQPPKFDRAVVHIVGSAPYVQHKFSQKAIDLMTERQRAGSQGEKSKRRREPKDFNEIYERAQHKAREGWHGIPAPAFRNSMIDACRLAGFAMTRAKLSLFVVPDGWDNDGQPLVKIIGKPRIHEAAARNASGVADIRWRPMWEKWSAAVTIRWDARQFSATDVINLMATAGMQVGIGEGRPSSPNSNGLDWGLWDVSNA